MLRFRISNKRESKEFQHAVGPIEFGRGQQRENTPRCIVQDLYVSKDHVRIEARPGCRVFVENLSQKNPIMLMAGRTVAPMESEEMDLPARLRVGETLIEIDGELEEESSSYKTILGPVLSRAVRSSVEMPVSSPESPPDQFSITPVPPGLPAITPSPPVPSYPALPPILSATGPGLAPTAVDPPSAPLAAIVRESGGGRAEKWTQLFETVITVQRAAANSEEFFERTARAMVDLVGLDQGLVLLRQGSTWKPVAHYARDSHRGPEFSRSIVLQVDKERRTFYQTPESKQLAVSLRGIEAVVASPILDHDDEVIGILYGARYRMLPTGISIGELEAQVTQVLAAAVGAGMARMSREAEVGRLRGQFEQFFSHDLAKELERNPKLLEGQDREITILFSDIRSFSTLSTRLQPSDVCRMVADVMELQTIRVQEFHGVVVDYMGDGMLAMWNAPASVPDHASLACKAALAIIADLPKLRSVWGNVRLGIGLNTGMALVGNTGNRLKFKYGPLGHSVNLASRVESATKQMGTNILITRSTHDLLQGSFATRRICCARVVGIDEPVDLFELQGEYATPDWQALNDAYERALDLQETDRPLEACRAIYPLINGNQHIVDVPSVNLLARAVERLKSPHKPFDRVWNLESK